MTRRLKDIEADERLRELIESRYGDRGRYTMLEEVSKISATKWKNFYYKKQSATQEMLGFWCAKYPEDSQWLNTGMRPPAQKGFPFGTRIPGFGGKSTLSQRLNWVIAEWASPRGADLFQYLENRSGGNIPARDWANVILSVSEPTAQMIQLVCKVRPMFTEWMILGYLSIQGPQVDPDNEASVLAWKDHMRKERMIMSNGVATNDDQTS